MSDLSRKVFKDFWRCMRIQWWKSEVTKLNRLVMVLEKNVVVKLGILIGSPDVNE